VQKRVSDLKPMALISPQQNSHRFGPPVLLFSRHRSCEERRDGAAYGGRAISMEKTRKP
jgi:hypothetical protein